MQPVVAAVSSGGSVLSRRNGRTRIQVSLPHFGLTTSVVVVTRNTGPYRWDYTRQIAPLLARANCAGASCHGASSGRGGFKLSLFGQDPEQDMDALIRGAGGRRINRLHPAASLLLRKPTMGLAHGGGLRFKVGSPPYRTLVGWIAAGTPRDGDPTRVERLEVHVATPRLSRPGESRQLLVTAHMNDGTREDVTEQALVESKNEAAVSAEGSRVSFVGLGESSVLVRFGGQAATVRFTATALPPLREFPSIQWSQVVDREVLTRLRRLRLPPAPAAPDAELVRRLYLDLTGRIPTPPEVERYCGSTDPGKRQALIDALLAGPEFSKHWRDNLNTLLMGRSAFPLEPGWAAWLEAGLRENRGWDRMVREMLLARPGTPEENGALQFLDRRFAQGETGLDAVTRDVSRVFFGVDIQCARCHTHPDVATWQQQAYWGIAAFFGRSYRIQVKGANFVAERAGGEVQYFGPDKNLRPALPVFLTGEAAGEPPMPLVPAPAAGMPAPPENPDLFLIPPEESKEKTRVPLPKYSRRGRLVEIAVTERDPFFKRAVVNWVWSTLMGRGLVEPVDQMHAGNPASHPELLTALADGFAREGFSLRKLIRTVVSSQAYGRSSEWRRTAGLSERPGPELYAVAAVRPQSVQQLAGSMLTAAGYLGGAVDAPGATDAGQVRARFEALLVAQFAELRKNLDSGTELFQPNVAQALYLANNRAFQQLLDKGGLSARLANLTDDGEVIRQAYLSVLSRPPEAEEATAFRRHLSVRRQRRAEAVSQIVWALVTSSEFRFIH